jgi:hypothetical protein
VHEQGSYAQLSEAGGELVSLMEAYGQTQGDDESSEEDAVSVTLVADAALDGVRVGNLQHPGSEGVFYSQPP